MLRKKLRFKFLFCFVFSILAIENIAAQVCPGLWDVGTSLNFGCFFGKWVGQFNSNSEPVGCPINPVYTSGQSNTFTFDFPVESFIIDFTSFTTAAGCGKMEIKINNVFYPLNTSNLIDMPSSIGCPGVFSFIALTNEGYITSTNNSQSSSNGHGRIIINGVNATSVTISTNDPAGTIVSAPFNCTIIPLKLETFTGESENCKASLNWKTGIEFNVKNIEVQRSEDGNVFNKVGEVIPKGSDSKYSFITANISDAFFRLKIIDLDGSFNYSEIIYLKSFCNKLSYEIIPNPAFNEIEIVKLKNTDKVIVSDMLGKVMLIFNTPQNNKLNIQSLPSGMYIFRIINGLNNSSLRVIKY